MATPLPRLDDPTPIRLPVIPKDAVFRRFCWDWIAPNGDRWDHKGNPLGKSLLWEHQNAKAHAAKRANP